MASSKELCSIREWAPLTEVIDLIPARLQRGFFPANLNLTCVDATEEFLAVGSDAGIVFWYNRHSGEMQKLKAEVATRITCVRIVNSVEYMVAAGCANGQVSVFQIQKELPRDLDLVAPCTRSRPIERYTIRDLHKCVVSCCEWSKNGMKLYSGDRQGVVVLTEFDYQAHLSKSVEILSEAYEIVQLSVQQSHLLVATLYRCIVCQRDAHSAQWNITQVGKKDRKQLIDCGAVFLRKQAANRPQLVCGRPGLRFWMADAEGNVSKTVLFKDAVLRSPTWEIPILNPKPRSEPPSSNHTALAERSGVQDGEVGHVASSNFRQLYLYDGHDSLLVTHDDATLYILNLERLKVEAVARGFRKILDFCVCGKEIFVLEGERTLLRLAALPEPPYKTVKVIFNPLMPPPVPVLGSSHYSRLESPVELQPEPALQSAEECFELSPVEQINLNAPIELAVESPLAHQNRRLEIFRRIGQMDFEQSIVHTSRKTSVGKPPVPVPNESGAGIVEIGHESHELRLPLTNAATLMEASYCQMENNGLASPMDMKAAFLQLLPDALSPTTLQKTVAEKAKTLAAELDLPEVHLAPPSQEELLAAQALAPQLSESLIRSYPTHLEEASVQTTPLEKPLNPADDYHAGQPVDGIRSLAQKPSRPKMAPLKFVKSLPKPKPTLEEDRDDEEEYTSFLPDFRRAGDPLRKETPATSDSNTSSEWEFLDN
ncbi:LOW QUALITY PROTEIN: WD repeat-containing protein CG11141 [Drosophila gunungcola]|uniref:LOW QUALITY PROTEIN: WD repeat-containing protein CG11141 n=1 Tax=Drosophila gunungcola TaxID=103775 RepID=UPI0022E5AEE6|nr:LOW QUALITY PROTEIN: WD repeat-containing protein CG11141 [Drosophila gunungcola]